MEQKRVVWVRKQTFFKRDTKKYSEIKERSCMQMFEIKIAYQEFYCNWNKNKMANRSLLRSYLFINNKKIFILCILSFLIFNIFNKILKIVGKSI